MREGGDQFSSAARKFSRAKSQETNSLQNKRRKVELYMEICKRKQKKQKRKTRDNEGFLVILRKPKEKLQQFVSLFIFVK